ncbi:MAG: F-box protein [Verrucomicrobia bacterium]|nr:F-box protein [Verrucomicrobiota bacterium]
MSLNIEAAPTPAVITELPRDMQLEIINKLDVLSLLRLKKTCMCFYNIITLENESVWKQALRFENGGHLPKKIPQNWGDFCIEQQLMKRNIRRGLAANPFPATMWGLGKFSYKNDCFVLQGFSELALYNLTTGEKVGAQNCIPKEAFVPEAPEPVRLNGHYVNAVDSVHFALQGTIVSIWNAKERNCLFAARQDWAFPIHVSDSNVIFQPAEDRVEVWDFKTKTKIAAFAPLSEDHGRILHAFDSAVFTLSYGCRLSCYDYKKKCSIFSDWQFKHYADKTDATFLKTKDHVVALTVKITSPAAFVAACVNVRTWSGRTIQIGRPECFLAGLNNLKNIAKAQGDHLFGIDAQNPCAVSCWNLSSGNIEKRFTTPLSVWTFKVTGLQKVIATTCEATTRFKIFVWDMDCPEKPRLEIASESYDCKARNNILCIREVAQFRFFDLAKMHELGSIPFNAYQQQPILADFHTEWTFDGSRIHIIQPPGQGHYWLINLNEV